MVPLSLLLPPTGGLFAKAITNGRYNNGRHETICTVAGQPLPSVTNTRAILQTRLSAWGDNNF